MVCVIKVRVRACSWRHWSMFSPATRRSHGIDKDRRSSSRRNAAAAAGGFAFAANEPSTPSPPPFNSTSAAIPNRPATGTPAPWSSRLSVLARYYYSFNQSHQLLRNNSQETKRDFSTTQVLRYSTLVCTRCV